MIGMLYAPARKYSNEILVKCILTSHFCLESLLQVYFSDFFFPFPLPPMQLVQNNVHLQNDLLLWHFLWSPFCRPGTSVAVSSVLLALVMAGRAAFVFPLSFLSNLAKKSALGNKYEFVVFFFLPNQLMMLFNIIIYLYFFCSDHNMVGWSHERCCIYGTCI